MDWSDEQWVKLYRRDTADWLLLSWRARGLFYSLLRIVTRAGVLDLGKTGKRAVAVLLGAGSDWKEIVDALDELVADGSVRINGTTLVIPNFVEAQEAVKSDKARAKAARERRRDEAIAASESPDNVTKRDAAITDRDGGVTGNEAASRGVTERHAASRREEMEKETKTEGRGGVGEQPPADPPPVEEPKASPPGVPPSGATSAPPPEAPKVAKGKRPKPAPEPDTIPLPGTLARRVFDAIVGDVALAPIVANPGDASQRWADPGTYPGVDVLAEVRRAGEYAATKPGRYTDGRAFLRGWLQRKADEVARMPKPAGAAVAAAPRPTVVDATRDPSRYSRDRDEMPDLPPELLAKMKGLR